MISAARPEKLLENLLRDYRSKRAEIKRRLAQFEELGKEGSDVEIFAELCFCLCTPQSKARVCDSAVKELERTGKLFSATSIDIMKLLKRKSWIKNLRVLAKFGLT